MQGKCFLTGVPSGLETHLPNGRDAIRVNSPACGVYEISRTMSVAIANRSSEERLGLAGAVRQLTEEGYFPTILTTSTVESLLDGRPFPQNTTDQVNHFVRYLRNKSARPGTVVEIKTSHDYPIMFAHSREEFEWLIGKARDDGYIRLENEAYSTKNDSTIGRKYIVLSPTGWEHSERLNQAKKSTEQELNVDRAKVKHWLLEEFRPKVLGHVSLKVQAGELDEAKAVSIASLLDDDIEVLTNKEGTFDIKDLMEVLGFVCVWVVVFLGLEITAFHPLVTSLAATIGIKEEVRRVFGFLTSREE